VVIPTPKPPRGEVLIEGRKGRIQICDVPLSDGTTQKKALLVHPGAVAILPVTDDGQIVFIRNHRWTVGEAIIELPAGTLDKPGEPVEASAARELEEEAGLIAAHWRFMGAMYAVPGGSTEVMHLYCAQGLTQVGQKLEPDERIEVVPMPIEHAREWLITGRFVDMKTVAALGMWFAQNA
jgi:ADP-ribose pyrophosphatase